MLASLSIGNLSLPFERGRADETSRLSLGSLCRDFPEEGPTICKGRQRVGHPHLNEKEIDAS